jgi:hypothetical protein
LTSSRKEPHGAASNRTQSDTPALPIGDCEYNPDPDLAAVVATWPELPEAIRVGLPKWADLPEAIRVAIESLFKAAAK